MSSDKRTGSTRESPEAEGGLPGRVAVSGGNGFIARRFIELYQSRFEGVSALVRDFPAVPLPGVDYRVCDVTEPHSVRFALRGCSRFVHSAYDFRNRQSAVAAAENVISACRSEGVERLVHVSTNAVYDQTGDGVADERTRPAPYRDPYIESKLRIERLLAAHWRAGYRGTVILQPTVVYGWPGSWSRHAFRACRAERLELPLAGEGVCNSVYVDDVCQAVFRALTAEIDGGRSEPPRYLINGPDEVTWRAFFEAHARVLEMLVQNGSTGDSTRPGEHSRLAIEAPPSSRRFADDPKVDLAMSLAFRPLAARPLYSALGLRRAKSAPSPAADDDLAALRSRQAGETERFKGMGRLYMATRYRADSGLAARELGYAPEFDLERGVEHMADALRPVAPRLQTVPRPGMLIDLERESPTVPIRRRVCIIGTGIGGGALATSLLRRGDDVVVVEAGNGGGDEDKVALESAGLEFGLAIYRDIAVGGSGNVWRGLCSPRDPIELEPRDWIPESGWPIGYDDLARHNRAAAALLGLDDYDLFFDHHTVDGDGARADAIRFDRDRFELKYFLQTRPPRSFRGDLLGACASPGGPVLLQNAPALELVSSADRTRIEKLVVKDGGGGSHHVAADIFVVCAGALETPRLLLNSDDGAGIGNRHDVVGRYLMDHPMVGMGQVRLRRPRTAPLFQALPLTRHSMIKAGVVMRGEALREHRLPNHCVILLPSLRRGFDDNYERARRTLITARQRRLSLADIATVASNPNVIQWALSYVSPLPALFRYADLFFISEQTPHASSRVDLSEQTDGYGYRRARARWQVSEDDIDSIVRFNELLLAAFPEDRYEVTYRRERERIVEAVTSAAHFCGTARMGSDPRSSVIDADLKVWGVENLYVCDASALPTSGNANPGLTIAALAVRLAERLTRCREAPRSP